MSFGMYAIHMDRKFDYIASLVSNSKKKTCALKHDAIKQRKN